MLMAMTTDSSSATPSTHRRSGLQFSRFARWTAALGAMLVPAMAASAQAASQRPPVPSETAEPPIILTYLIMVVLVAVAVFAQTVPSKRGHQD